MTRLSIIVPLYKSAKYMPKCIDSLVSQDIPLSDYEIILINDGSPDDSLLIAESYAKQYSNIKVLSQENKGASGARNTGLDYATGSYIRFVDPDDFVPKNSFKQYLDQMDNENLDMLRFNYQMVDENYRTIDKPASAQHINYSDGVISGSDFLAERLGFACFIWTFVIRRTLIQNNNIRFYEGDYYDDTPWTPRTCLKASRVNSTNTIGYYYYQRSDSLVKDASPETMKKKQEGHKFLIKELNRQRTEVNLSVVRRWYDGMISHCALSMLNRVAKHDYSKRDECIEFLRDQNVFPLSTYMSEPKTARKIIFANFAPRLYCWALHRESL